MIKDGKRQSQWVAFLQPVAENPNLTVSTDAYARRLLFDGTRCVGVQVGDAQIRAEQEVIVCAGALESPKLLLLSGIGPAELLRRVGVDVLVDLPGVGENLHDHSLIPAVYAARKPVPPTLPGLTPLHAHLFWRSTPGLVVPDQQPLFFHIPLYFPGMEGPPEGFTLLSGLIRPAGRGSVRLASADPDVRPLVDPGFLACEEDVESHERGLELVQEIGASSAVAEWDPVELYPGAGVRSRTAVRDYIRQTATTYQHVVGTCRMGVDTFAVVDPELRVYGVEGLRVVDASVMPAVPSGNTHAPTTMIAERASDLVRAALGASERARAAIHA
jgi:choline dehydrogenase